MSRFTGILLGTLIVLALGAITVANATVAYEAILEWNGPYFKIINNATVDQKVDNPVVDIPFVQPYAVAAREHDVAGGRDVVYVVDSGHNRVQAFEVNGTYYNDNSFSSLDFVPGGVAAAGGFGPAAIWPSQYCADGADAPSRFIVPGSESVVIDGVTWSYVADLTGFTPADKVYTIDYDAIPGPIIALPATPASLSATSTIALRYALTDYQGTNTVADRHVFGAGDVDYGVDKGSGLKEPVVIDQATGGAGFADEWGIVRSIAVIANEAAPTSDDIFLLDAVGTPQLFSYNVTTAGVVNKIEKYDDVLTTPYDVAVATGDQANESSVAASATIDLDTGPFNKVAPLHLLAGGNALVTGHRYGVDCVYDPITFDATVEITDLNTSTSLGAPVSIIGTVASAATVGAASPFTTPVDVVDPLDVTGLTYTVVTSSSGRMVSIQQPPGTPIPGATNVNIISEEATATPSGGSPFATPTFSNRTLVTNLLYTVITANAGTTVSLQQPAGTPFGGATLIDITSTDAHSHITGGPDDFFVTAGFATPADVRQVIDATYSVVYTAGPARVTVTQLTGVGAEVLFATADPATMTFPYTGILGFSLAQGGTPSAGTTLITTTAEVIDLSALQVIPGLTLALTTPRSLANGTTTIQANAEVVDAAGLALLIPGLDLDVKAARVTSDGTTTVTTVAEIPDITAIHELIPGLDLAINVPRPTHDSYTIITTVKEVIAAPKTEVQADDGLVAGGLAVTTAAVSDASQVTGHTYTIEIDAADAITITDDTIGQTLVDAAAYATVPANCLAIPGITFAKAAATTTDRTSHLVTVKEVVDRYLFVADTGADRIKVIAASDDAVTTNNDWLPGDVHTMTAQPTDPATVGLTANVDYWFYETPTSVPEDWAVNTLAFPIKEGTLEGIQMPANAAVALTANWTRIDDLVTANPTDQVYSVDWTTGKIQFGDGVHGKIPEPNTTFEFTYTTTPDVLRYGSSGSGPGRFSAPRAVAARWNVALGVYDVYVADTGNNRIQKLAFTPADRLLGLPARMDFVCEWNTGGTGVLNNPVDIAVMLDRQVAASAQLCYLAVADQGNNRIVTYQDVAATSGGGSAVPTWDAAGGGLGNSLGLYTQIDGVCFLPNGNDLDLYTCDGQRGVVTKYEVSVAPTIGLTYVTLDSQLPKCFPQSSSYTFAFDTENPPVGGHIDFYYDTVAEANLTAGVPTFDPLTAKLCFPADSILASATTAVWVFADSPGGAPVDRSAADGGYYLFARMKDSNGTVVATASTTSSELLCMDSTLLPGFRGVDRIDGDRTLYLQNDLERVVDLTLAFPEAIIGVAIGGTFPDSIIEVTAIDPGNGWDGTNYINTIFNQGFSTAPDPGIFLVNTSVTGSPLGLSGTSEYVMAEMSVKSKTAVLTPTRRFVDGMITLVQSKCDLVDTLGASPATALWTTRNVNLRWGYLGDLATSGIGADSTLPHLVVDPDGLINFEDQMVLTLGWNGVNNIQDRIADIGPTEGTVPNLRPIPDGKWNVDDLLAFTVMYSWAADAGYYKDASGLLRTNEARPVALGAPVLGPAAVRSVSVLEMPKAGEFMTVDLNVDGVRDLSGALINVGFDPARLELVSVENGGFLDGKSGSLFFKKSGQGWLEVSTSRLDQEQPGVSGGGTVARATFRILDENAGDLSVQYDLRSATGKVLGRGTSQAGAYTGGAVGFQLYAAHPNPTRGSANIVYSVPTATNLSLNVYDVTGRQVRSLFSGRRDAGYHVAQFDGRDDAGNSLAGGIYFYRLQANGKTATQKLTLSR